MTPMESIFEQLLLRVEVLMGRPPVAVHRVSGRGFSMALRLQVTFSDNSSVFVKAATTEDTATWLRQEKGVYEALDGLPYLPQYLGWGEPTTADDLPFLVLEDLTSCYWPPPWSSSQVEGVLRTLSKVHAYDGNLRQILPRNDERDSSGWQAVAEDPQPFLGLGICSLSWLDHALPSLVIASETAQLDGDSLLHMDVRSDNMALRSDGTAVLFDWNWARCGSPKFDIACWLPSLEKEGGPKPEEILPKEPEFAAWISGYFAARAGLPPPSGAPTVRGIQRQQLSTALPWAIRQLGLPPLDVSALCQ